ncbi:hypothetical protein [Sorangium sp. So ce426]|uniref:hypothetical protein n=1 Tax=Sorangium sp. So ce426 TaxID=3133312 RepID=UPI003F5C6521
MIPADHEDRLERLRRRGEALFRDMKRAPPEHRQLMEHAWEEALRATHGALAFPDAASAAALKTSRLDAILCLIERVTRPSSWLDDQAMWFNRAQCCLLDAVSHAAGAAPRPPPPILAVEPIDSPLYVPRARVPAAWLSQATPADLPLPVVLCPGNLLEEPWAWATLFHELGHHLDAARGDTFSVVRVLEEEDDDLGSWAKEKWVGEVIADLYAGMLGGPGAVETLRASLTTTAFSASHPSDADRIAILDAAWTGVRDGEPPQGDRPRDIVARALVNRFQPWQRQLRHDCARPEGPLDSARLLPGTLRLRHEAGTGPEALRKACQEAFTSGHLGRPEWVLTPAHLETLARAMRNLVETRVQPGTESLKVPPVELFVRHDRMSFIGATHGQFLAALREAMKHRTKRYEHIELFALADEPLRELILGGKTGDVLIEERNESLRAIRDYLTRENVPHCIYIYTQPYLFASFWDSERVEARPGDAPPAHIHVSSALWGMDLRSAVGQDLEAPAGVPLPPAMKRLVEALEQLRKMSRKLA